MYTVTKRFYWFEDVLATCNIGNELLRIFSSINHSAYHNENQFRNTPDTKYFLSLERYQTL